ncbi:MAG: hypothetical protein MJZ03_04905 [archaeon]|nr:hypothetical protein [archaeon]
MQIPLIPMLSNEENNAYHVSISFDGLTPRVLNSNPVKVTISNSYSKSITAVIDVKGLQRKNFDIVLLKKLNIRRLWILTNIDDTDDIFDVFNANIESIMVPTHTVRSVEEMKDIFNISDSVIPVMFIRKGTCVCTGDNLRYQDALKRLTNIGFGTVATFDLDDSLTEWDWKSLVKDPTVIPLSMSGKFSGDRFSEIGFEKYFTLCS